VQALTGHTNVLGTRVVVVKYTQRLMSANTADTLVTGAGTAIITVDGRVNTGAIHTLFSGARIAIISAERRMGADARAVAYIVGARIAV